MFTYYIMQVGNYLQNKMII